MSGVLWQQFLAISEIHKETPAIIQGERRVTFGELRREAGRAAAEMRRLGLRPGDRCLIWSSNSPELAAAMLGSWLVGAVIALVNDEAPTRHLVHAAAVTEPRLAVVEARVAQTAADSLSCPLLVLGSNARSLDDSADSLAVPSESAASVFFTSGSTGSPKGVVQSHANLIAGCRMVAAYLGLSARDRILCPIPWSFDYGYGQFLSTVLLGVPQVLPTARSPFAICEAIQLLRPTVFAGLPSLFSLLLSGLSPIGDIDLGSIRMVTNTGGAIPRGVFAEVRRVFAHCDISLNYGLTETYRSAGLPFTLAAKRPESVGFPYPGVSLSVVREDGTEAEAGEVGEVVHRGTGTFLGYWGDPVATAKVLRPDPLPVPGRSPSRVVFTGDLGWKDAEGFLMIRGRRDRLIKSMGVRVSPDEIERLFRGTNLVRDVAIVGIPHDLVGEMVVAAVVLPENAPSPLSQLKAFARRTMSPPMQPRAYEVMDAFPLTPNGKTDFHALRTLLSQTSGARTL